MEFLYPVFAGMVKFNFQTCIFLGLSCNLMYLYLFKAMIIIAWNGSGKLSGIFQGDVFLKVLSIFITAAILKLAQGDYSSTYIPLSCGSLIIFLKTYVQLFIYSSHS